MHVKVRAKADSMSPKRLYAQTLAADPNSKTWWCQRVGPEGVRSRT